MENRKLIGKEKIQVLIVILMVTFIWGYWMNLKTGFNWDELTSYGAANSNYSLWFHSREQEIELGELVDTYIWGDSVGEFAANLSTFIKQTIENGYKSSDLYKVYRKYQTQETKLSWAGKEDIYDYLTVNKGEQLNIASIYECNWEDTHPPLYHILLNAVCSLFPGVMSKWFGFVINIAALWGTCVFVYGIMRRLGAGHGVAVLTIAVYGSSVGAASTALYIRMYALMTLAVVALIFQHMCLKEKEYQISRKVFLFLVLNIVLGYLIQYYFCIVALVVFIISVIDMLSKKYYRECKKYTLCFLFSAVVGLCIWPFGVKHMFLRGRGPEALSNLGEGSRYGAQLSGYLTVIKEQVFVNGAVCTLVVAMLALSILLLYRRRKKLSEGKLNLILIPVLIYLLFVAIISPEVSERYIACVYPLFMVIILFIFDKALLKNRKWIAIFAFVAFAIISFQAKPSFLPIIGDKESEMLKKYSEKACIYVEKNYCYQMHLMELADYQKVMIVNWEHLDYLFNGETDLPDEIVLYVSCLLEPEEIIEEFKENTDYSQFDILLDNTEEYGEANVFFLSGQK